MNKHADKEEIIKAGDIVRIKWYGEWANCIVVELWSGGKDPRVNIPCRSERGRISWDADTRCDWECVKVKNPNRIKNKIIREALLDRQKKIIGPIGADGKMEVEG